MAMSLGAKREKLKQKCERLFDKLHDSTDAKCVDRWLKSVYDLAKLDKEIEDSNDAKMRQRKKHQNDRPREALRRRHDSSRAEDSGRNRREA